MAKSTLREAIVERLLRPAPPPRARRSNPSRGRDGITLGRLVLLKPSGIPLVKLPGNPPDASVPARSAVALQSGDVGREAVLFFEEGDRRRPVILGLLQCPSPKEMVEVRMDGKRLYLSAENEIVLRCGKASLTLTRAGKVLIRGAYLSSRSSGVHRIKGGSVQIN